MKQVSSKRTENALASILGMRMCSIAVTSGESSSESSSATATGASTSCP